MSTANFYPQVTLNTLLKHDEIEEIHTHYDERASSSLLSVSIEGALAVLLYMNRTHVFSESMSLFTTCCDGNTLNATIPLAEDYANAADIFSCRN